MKKKFGLEKTKNNYGFQHQNSSITDDFILYAKIAKYPVLDIGAAYGGAVLPCLKNGAQVIAVDICQEHLDILEENTPTELKKQLTTYCVHFPQCLHLEADSISGVLLAHILTFLSIQELEKAIALLYKWLVLGGKVFVVNYTPYHKTIRNFIPIFLERKSMGNIWPGYVENKWEYSNGCELAKELPAKLHLFDDEILERVFTENGFVIEKCFLFGGSENGVPGPFRLDGREWVGLIARKT